MCIRDRLTVTQILCSMIYHSMISQEGGAEEPELLLGLEDQLRRCRRLPSWATGMADSARGGGRGEHQKLCFSKRKPKATGFGKRQ